VGCYSHLQVGVKKSQDHVSAILMSEPGELNAMCKGEDCP